MTDPTASGPMAQADGREPDAPSAVLAAQLRDQPEQLDELSRARMERSLLQALRQQGLPRAGREAHGPRVARGVFIASVALSACAGGLLALYLARGAQTPEVVPGRFELRIDDAAVQSGPISESQLLESGAQGRIALELHGARLDMQPTTQLRLERLSDTELAFSLLAGQLDIDFHPERRGEQRLRVETRSARVLVVGTRLRVEVDGHGDTRVRVMQGAVDVVTRSSGRTRRVVAGEELLVRADEGDARERSLREALERDMASVPAPEPAAQTEPAGEALEPVPLAAHGERLEVARRLLVRGRYGEARAVLRRVAEQSAPLELRVEALTLMAESYAAQGSISRAADQYRRADALAPKHPAGDNARFALARLLDRQAHDGKGAIAAYRRYLALAPQGALARQAREALCRLGSTADCH